MIPYLGTNMALVGGNTFGKPVGQDGFDLAACDLRIRALTFQTVNANGQGEYFNGLAGVVPNSCRAGDDITRPLGDTNEASIRTALDFLAGRSCTPIAGSPKGADEAQRARSGLDLPDRLPLMSDRPRAGQFEVPGMF
jgi:hypothetical protein